MLRFPSTVMEVEWLQIYERIMNKRLKDSLNEGDGCNDM